MTTHGSQLQTQIYVNRRPGELSAVVLAALPSLAARTRLLGWVAPLEPDYLEPRDDEFLRAIGRSDLARELREFWPPRGPVWDALAVAVLPDGRPGVVLAEGKGHPAELRSGGTQASAASREHILRAIRWTHDRLGVDADPELWLGPLYQLANRVAHVVWLREHGVEAWLVHLLFADDRTNRPFGEDELRAAMHDAHRELLLPDLDYVSDAVLPALAQSELSRSPERA
jgi:hypothetical protein